MKVYARNISTSAFAKMDFPEDDSHIYELVEGNLYQGHAPPGRHQYAQSELFYKMMHHVSVNGLGRVFASPTAVLLTEYSAPQPDLVFLSKEKMSLFDPQWGIKGAPDIMVEIVSPTSYKRDHLLKKELYAAHGIPEYWIVDPSYHSVEVFVLQDGRYERHAFGIDGETVGSHVLSGFELIVSSIFLDIIRNDSLG